MADPVPRLNIHATGLVLDGCGVLLRGPPGAGKSLLALELLERWPALGRTAALVGDDRLDIARTAAGLVMSAPAALAGRIELRGRGIVLRPAVRDAAIALLVDLVDDLVRMPEAGAFTDDLMGDVLPRCPVPRRGVADSAHQALLIGEALRALQSDRPAKTQKIT